MAGGRCARTARFCLLPGPPSLRSLIHLLGGESSATRRSVPAVLGERYPAISVAPRLVSVPAHAHPRFARFASEWQESQFPIHLTAKRASRHNSLPAGRPDRKSVV